MKLELSLNIDTTLKGDYGWDGGAFREGVVDLVSAIGYALTFNLIGSDADNDAIVRVFCDPNDYDNYGIYRILVARAENSKNADITSVLYAVYRGVDRSGNFERIFTNMRDDKKSAEIFVQRKARKETESPNET